MRKAQIPRAGAPKRDHRGFRGTPPPLAGVSLEALADDTLLTEYEIAALGRYSTNTVAGWRRQPNHPLEWEIVPGGFVRYRAGKFKRFLAGGQHRQSKGVPPKTPAQARLETEAKKPAARPPRRERETATAAEIEARPIKRRATTESEGLKVELEKRAPVDEGLTIPVSLLRGKP